jgi:hypothetical protein
MLFLSICCYLLEVQYTIKYMSYIYIDHSVTKAIEKCPIQDSYK